MADTREAILVRLGAIVAGVDGFRTVGRNHVDLEDDDLPGISVVDFDEDERDQDQTAGDSKMPSRRPQVMVLKPMITVALIGKREDNGPKASELRARLIHTITNDATILGYCDRGRAYYKGVRSLPAKGGRGHVYNMGLIFHFHYIFRPSDLAEI